MSYFQISRSALVFTRGTGLLIDDIVYMHKREDVSVNP